MLDVDLEYVNSFVRFSEVFGISPEDSVWLFTVNGRDYSPPKEDVVANIDRLLNGESVIPYTPRG
jgi:hypothetical protein